MAKKKCPNPSCDVGYETSHPKQIYCPACKTELVEPREPWSDEVTDRVARRVVEILNEKKDEESPKPAVKEKKGLL